ncbi:MAG: DUF4145 domain-containing protein [Candidatus Electrothrix sp. AW3_4]|nr:DUF4145 domain-containing protein [Candidatus Electrothrix gigas]
MTYYNSSFMSRFDELISEGERLWEEFKNNDNGMIMDIVAFTKWSTSCLNLLDKLSVSTNRFVTQFEIWVSGGPERKMNIGAALGVLKSARHEYSCGMAIEYHLSVSATIFGGLLDEASYLLRKKYNRAAAVLLGAALEEGLKTRARSVPTITIRDKDTLHPVIHKIKSSDAGLINEFEAKQLEAVAKMRNDAAHGGDFNYTRKEVEQAYKQVESTLQSLLSSS